MIAVNVAQETGKRGAKLWLRAEEVNCKLVSQELAVTLRIWP